MMAARLARAYPSLSIYSAATLAEELCAIERAQRRHAERCCSGEDGGYVRKRAAGKLNGIGDSLRRNDVEHDPDAEARAEERIRRKVARWSSRVHDLLSGASRTGSGHRIERQYDPRGSVLLIQLPGEAEAVAV